MKNKPVKFKNNAPLSEPSYSYSPDRDVVKSIAGRPIRIAIYKRISALTAESVTFERQHDEVVKFLKDSFGIDIDSSEVDYVIFEEEGTAFKNKRRPEFDKMINAIDRGEFTHLAAYALDRLFRRTDVSGIVTPVLQRSGIVLCIKDLGASLDLSELSGMMMWSMYTLIAQASSTQTQGRTLGSQIVRHKYGVSRGGRAPYGMKAVSTQVEGLGGDRTLFHVDDEPRDYLPNNISRAAIVREAYRRVGNGQSTQSIVRWLNTTNIPTPSGGDTKWSQAMVTRMLSNTVYMGVASHNNVPLTDDNGKYIQTHQELIPIAEWEKIQILLISRTPKLRTTRRSSPIAGVVECGDCGHVMYASRQLIRGEEYRVFRCNRKFLGHKCGGISIGLEGLEKTIFLITKGILDNPTLRSKFIAPIDVKKSPEDTKVEAALKEEIVKYEARLADEDDAEMKKSLEEIIAVRKGKLAAIAARQHGLQTYVANATTTTSEQFEQAWNADDKMNVQLMLQTIYKSIEIGKAAKHMNRLGLAKRGWTMDLTRLTIKFHNGFELKYEDVKAIAGVISQKAA